MASQLARAIAEKAKRDEPINPQGLLSTLLDKLIEAFNCGAIANGSVASVSATTGNGKSVTLQIEQAPDKLIALYQEALDLLNGVNGNVSYARFCSI